MSLPSLPGFLPNDTKLLEGWVADASEAQDGGLTLPTTLNNETHRLMSLGAQV